MLHYRTALAGLRWCVARLVLAGLVLLHVGASHATAQAPSGGSDSAAVVVVVERFHQALATADSATALSLLHPGVVILESGNVETLSDYRSHHLPADIEFASTVPSKRVAIRAVVRGDAAWVTSASTTQGSFRSRAIDSAGAELMVLAREPEGWQIHAIHWSSHSRRTAP